MAERVEDVETRKELRPVWEVVVRKMDEMLAADLSLSDIRPEDQAILRDALTAVETTRAVSHDILYLASFPLIPHHTRRFLHHRHTSFHYVVTCIPRTPRLLYVRSSFDYFNV